MKIKRKVEMTCGEFAKYMVDKFGLSSYGVKLSDGYWVGNPEREYDVSIHLPPSKISDLPDITITKSGVVIFEVEEEITEDTVIPKVLNIFKNTTNRIRNDEESHIRRNVSVKEIKENSKDYVENDRLYIMNDDLTMTLIWTKENGLVE